MKAHHLVITLVAAGILIFACSCHNLDVPLENDVPQIVNSTGIDCILYYPDTIVCTLQIKDLNDTQFNIKSIVNDTSQLILNVGDTTDWPGNYFQYNNNFDTKEIILTLPGHDMGILTGKLCICDEHDASVILPYTIQRSLLDTFTLLSPNNEIWSLYSPGDADQIIPEYYISNLMLQFFFDSDANDRTVGIRSKFCLNGDFCLSILFGLKENIDELTGIEVSFFVSTSPDTGEYSGIKAGFDIYCEKKLLHIKTGMGLNLKSQVITFFTGNMKIERKGTEMSLYCWDENVQSNPNPLKTVSFPLSDTLYVHLRMKAEPSAGKQFCRWDNFIIQQGQLSFKKYE